MIQDAGGGGPVAGSGGFVDFDDYFGGAQEFVAYSSPADGSAECRGDNKQQEQQRPGNFGGNLGGQPLE